MIIIQEGLILVSIVIVLALGMFSQWLAWRIQWPSIVIMTIAGLIIGPITGFVNPQEALGELYSPIISLFVALILFEGATSLDIRELKGISKSVFRIVTVATLIAWIGGSLAAHYVANLSLEISFIIGGLLVVTGPTVIIPLLRQAKLSPRVSSVLKWEGIVVDPIGPLLALFAYEIIKISSADSFRFTDFIPFFIDSILAVIVGYVIGILLSYFVGKGLIPEYLKPPIIFTFVLICFTVGEFIMHETGLLAVTVMGLTLARSKKYVHSIGSIGHFIENISVLFTSTVFIIMTASLTKETIAQIFTWPIILYVLAMLFIVRPLSIWLSTIGTELTWQEKTLVGWIAPRGIVALSVSGYFAGLLVEDGYTDATLLTSLTLALVFITVTAHGFSIGPLARKLGLANDRKPGVLIVGASSFAIALADHLKKMDIPVMITDSNGDRLYHAKKLGIHTYHGEILSEHSDFEIDMTPYETILALKGDSAYNALVCQTYFPEFGYNNTFTLPVEQSKAEYSEFPPSIKANLLFGENETFRELNKKVNIGYALRTIKIENKLMMNDLKGTPLFVKRKNGKLSNPKISFVTINDNLVLNEGDEVVVLEMGN